MMMTREEYRRCTKVLLIMWMDNIITDAEYYLIVSKLNKHWINQEGKDG